MGDIYYVYYSGAKNLGTFTNKPIQFRLFGTTVYFIDKTLKIYKFFLGSYSLQNSGPTLSAILNFVYFDISADGKLLVFMLGDKTLNTLTYNSTSTYF